MLTWAHLLSGMLQEEAVMLQGCAAVILQDWAVMLQVEAVMLQG